jgi:hypothetical protein
MSADGKRLPPVELVAVRDGFYRGERIRAGVRDKKTGELVTFTFYPAKEGVYPNWAAPPGQKAALAPLPAMRNGDLRPAKARAATRTKTGSFSEPA